MGNGSCASVFVHDFFDMVERMEKGKISGRFTFTKHGQNYGCCMAEIE